MQQDNWPSLPLADWQDTYATLHLWTQIVGKLRLKQSPWINHSWHVTLYVTTRGLTTSPIPYGARTFAVDFDFMDHQLRITTSEGASRSMALGPRSVADFYGEIMAKLNELGITVPIYAKPNEVVDAIPFAEDQTHASYDADAANRFWRVMVQSDRVFQQFRARYIGKCSPVHYFWGGCDLAVTRFSGRTAPPHPGGFPNMPDWITREAYSHEVSSCGFWPGGGPLPFPLYYAYAYPAPDGFSAASVGPKEAYFSPEMGEFVLPYDDVRRSSSPDAMLLEFMQTTYEAAADRGGWDRGALERGEGGGA